MSLRLSLLCLLPAVLCTAQEADDTIVESPEQLNISLKAGQEDPKASPAAPQAKSGNPAQAPAPKAGKPEQSGQAATASHEDPLWLQEEDGADISPAEPTKAAEEKAPTRPQSSGTAKLSTVEPAPIAEPASLEPTNKPTSGKAAQAPEDNSPPPAAGSAEDRAIQEEELLFGQGLQTAYERRMNERKSQEKNEDKHVVSQSRMFSVSGGDTLRMGAIASRADELHGRLCHLLGISKHWRYSISIRLLGKSSDAPQYPQLRTRIRIIGKDANFQIRIHAGGGIDIPKMDAAIIHMLLYEYALRQYSPEEFPDSIRMPEWLISGLHQAILWKSGKADRRLYQNLFERAEMLSPEAVIDIKNAEQLDASSRQVYDVSCGVLVMCLLNREGGQAQLRSLLQEAASEEGTPEELIKRNFHEIGIDGASLSKWWALELAALATPQASELMTPIESEKRLAEALLVTRMDEETQVPVTISIDNVYALTQIPNWKHALRSNMERLTKLSMRCFPGYRAIILEYYRAIGLLLNNGDVDAVQNIIGPLINLREQYIKTCLRGRDYLDWYEISHLGQKNSSQFGNYMNTMRLLRRDNTGPKTEISRYLDDIESLYQLKEGEKLPESLLQRMEKEHNAAADDSEDSEENNEGEEESRDEES